MCEFMYKKADEGSDPEKELICLQMTAVLVTITPSVIG